MTQKKSLQVWLWIILLFGLVTPTFAQEGQVRFTSSFTLSIDSTYTDYVRVNWSQVTGAYYYKIQRWGEYRDDISLSTLTDSPTYYDYLLDYRDDGGRYCYMVTAYSQTNQILAISDAPCIRIHSSMWLNVTPGINSNSLSWTPTNGLETAYYRIARWPRNGSSAFNGLIYFQVPAFTTRYLDQQKLATKQEYCYQVQAMTKQEQVIKQSNNQCLTAGQVDLWIPKVMVTRYQNEVLVPVNLRNAGELRLGNADILVNYDGSILTPVSISPSPLTEKNYTFQANMKNYGIIRVTTLSGSAPPIYGSGTLFWITFQVHNYGFEFDSGLRFSSSFAGSEGTTLGNQQAQIIPTRLVNGVLQVSDNYRLGDIDGNNAINSFDVIKTLRRANTNPVPFDDRLFAGDTNGNGLVDTGDATMISYYIVHQNWPTLTMTNRPARQSAVTIGLSQTTGRAGEIVPIQLTAQNLANYAGGQFIVMYDVDVIDKIDHIETNHLARDFGLNYRDEAGMLKISMASNKAITVTGNIATIWVKLADNAPANKVSPLSLSQVSLNDLAGRDFATSALQQTIYRTAGQISITARTTYLPLLIK